MYLISLSRGGGRSGVESYVSMPGGTLLLTYADKMGGRGSKIRKFCWHNMWTFLKGICLTTFLTLLILTLFSSGLVAKEAFFRYVMPWGVTIASQNWFESLSFKHQEQNRDFFPRKMKNIESHRHFRFLYKKSHANFHLDYFLAIIIELVTKNLTQIVPKSSKAHLWCMTSARSSQRLNLFKCPGLFQLVYLT